MDLPGGSEVKTLQGAKSTLFKIFNSFLLSTSLFTLDFNHEKLKFISLFTSQTLGKSHVDTHHSFSYFSANLLIIGQPGYSSPIIFAALSKASQPASSSEAQSFSISNIDFI
jgi:hypothetical protein